LALRIAKLRIPVPVFYRSVPQTYSLLPGFFNLFTRLSVNTSPAAIYPGYLAIHPFPKIFSAGRLSPQT
jgi:hypothetical protein